MEDRELLMQEKKAAIAGIITEQLRIVTAVVEETTKQFRKPFIARCNRNPKKQWSLVSKALVAAFKLRSLEFQKQIIISQPIPKFPKGSHHESGIAIVGEHGKEEIIINRKK